jgi:hypothetical protein
LVGVLIFCGDQAKGNNQEKQKIKKQRKVSCGAVKPVDEDLYKIPPELLHQKSKKVLMAK